MISAVKLERPEPQSAAEIRKNPSSGSDLVQAGLQRIAGRTNVGTQQIAGTRGVTVADSGQKRPMLAI